MRTIIFSNGSFNHPEQDRARIHAEDRLISADGGLHHCMRLDLTPDVLVGDLDSVELSLLVELKRKGTEILEHPAKKDYTDLELALEAAIDRDTEEILILGGLGGRWDQTLANILLLTQRRFQSAKIRLVDGPQEISCLLGGQSLTIHGHPGATLSLIPVAGPAKGITTQGLEYELLDGTLSFGASRGVSNLLLGDQARITLDEGTLICVVIQSIEED